MLRTLLIILIAFYYAPNLLLAQSNTIKGANVLHARKCGKTRPLRELVLAPTTAPAKRNAMKANRPKFSPPNFINYQRTESANPHALPKGDDPLLGFQGEMAGQIVVPNVLIEGIDEDLSQVGVPDVNGDASYDHYIQIVNASWFQIFAKDGSPLSEPISTNTLWSEINKSSFGDPVIQYDEVAEKWLLTDLADFNELLYAVSETSDPFGAWELYSLVTPGFSDYPKYGIWPEAYIFTINEGGETYPVYAINRAQLLSGASTVLVQRVEIPGLFGGFPTATPFDWNGANLPPDGDFFVARLNDDAWGNSAQDKIEVWTIHIDWGDEANTTAEVTALLPAAFDTDPCSVNNGPFSYECIPQPNTTQGIDGIMTIIMHKIVYRNFGTHESAVLTFSADAGNDVSGVRWAELRRVPGGDWTIYQEGIVAPPDGINRFLGSIAINESGDIAIGYALSGTTKHPSLRFTGRLASDPLGEMSVEEYEMALGKGVRTGDRYGDYFAMTVDPLDQSFWFTGEYVKADGSFGTKIANFRLFKDSFDLAPVALLTPQNSPTLAQAEPVTIVVKNVGINPVGNFSVGYIFQNGAAIIEPAQVAGLAPDSIYTHTFATTVDMSLIGSYEFKVFTSFSEDEYSFNDTLRQIRRKLPRFDIGVTGTPGLDILSCYDSTTAAIVITNFGTETITAFNLIYTLNGGAAQSFNWVGTLVPGASVEQALPINGILDGTNAFIIKTDAPNGLPDEVPGNDSFSRDFLASIGGEAITLHILTDNYPEETSWELRNSDNEVIYAGGPYTGFSTADIYEYWCLKSDECYVFTIFDSYGDGLGTPGEPTGKYEIIAPDGTVLASIMEFDFGDEEKNEFCVDNPCLIEATATVTNATSLTTNDGIILVVPTAGAAPFSFSIDGGITFQATPLFDSLSVGEYLVVVRDTTGCQTEFVATVFGPSAIRTLGDNAQVLVQPNPSHGGVFQVRVSGAVMDSPTLSAQILDAWGRSVQRMELAGMDDTYYGRISLLAYPAGVYYLRLKNERGEMMMKLVKL